MKLSYKTIKELLDGDVFGVAEGDDGEFIVLQWERLADCRAGCDGYDGPLDEAEDVYTATWESKRTERLVWYVTHVYHEDGSVEETFRGERVE